LDYNKSLSFAFLPRNFEIALKRAGYKKGYIVAFSFTAGAYEEVARIKNKGELEIKLITVEELLTKHKI